MVKQSTHKTFVCTGASVFANVNVELRPFDQSLQGLEASDDVNLIPIAYNNNRYATLIHGVLWGRSEAFRRMERKQQQSRAKRYLCSAANDNRIMQLPSILL